MHKKFSASSFRNLLSLSLLSLVILVGNLALGTETSASGKPEVPQPSMEMIGAVSNPTAEVRFVDVRQGDAIPIRSSAGRTVLIDAGTGGGVNNLISNLRDMGATQIDLMIVTHAHSDHINGFNGIVEQFPLIRYMDPGYPHTTGRYKSLLDYIENNQIPYLEGRRGRNINMGDGVSLAILHPGPELMRGTRSDVNSNSIINRLDVGDICVLFTGDAEAATERALIHGGDNITCPVLKIPHHGGDHSTTAEFLQAVKPIVAVIMVGERNRYDHPGKETLQRLEDANVTVFRTDLDGTITMVTDGNAFSIKSSNRPEMSLPPQPSKTAEAGDPAAAN